MANMKDFIMSEIDKTIKRETIKKKIKESSKDLFDAVNASNQILNENASDTKKQMARNIVLVAEKKLREAYYDLDQEDDCDCEEGEGEMLKAQLLSILTNAEKLYHMIDDADQFEDWIQSKITIAEDYLRAAYGYLTYYNGAEDVENDWDGENDWDDVSEEEMEWEHEMEEESPSVREYKNESLDPEIDDDDLFANENLDEKEEKWIQKAISKPGQLHRDLGVPQGEKIPLEKLKAAAKKGGKIGQRARMALNLRKINK